MQFGLHGRCRQSCMGPPAPKNGAIRMTGLNVTLSLRAGTAEDLDLHRAQGY